MSFPDVPEAHTFGVNRADAVGHAVDALEAALSFYIDAGKELPAPGSKRGKGVVMISASALAEAKLQLYTAVRMSGIRKSELARRMGIANLSLGANSRRFAP